MANEEIEKVKHELAFWEDYLAWWESTQSVPVNPRLLEVITLAREKYQRARQLLPLH